MFRQGDVLLIPTTTTPNKTRKVARENGMVILAHGEATGHHHAIKHRNVQLVTSEQANELRMWLTVGSAGPVALTHQEHATIMVPPGSYEVRRQREYHPAEIRNVAD